MSITVQIKGDFGEITIEILGYENPAAQDPEDRNWLNCNVSIRVNGFSGSFHAAFVTTDFTHFRRELAEALRRPGGRASFITYEDALRFDVEFAASGCATVTGVAQVFDTTEAKLSFAFSSDQSFLATTLRRLDLVVREFPSREAL
jgi:hypothetical protein